MHHETNAAATGGKIGEMADIAALHTLRLDAAPRTNSGRRCRMEGNGDRLGDLDLINHYVRKIGNENHDTFVVQKSGEEKCYVFFILSLFASARLRMSQFMGKITPCVVCLRKISFRCRGTFAIEQGERSFLLFTGVPLCDLHVGKIVDTKKRRTV
jgi:hypothetical protein